MIFLPEGSCSIRNAAHRMFSSSWPFCTGSTNACARTFRIAVVSTSRTHTVAGDGGKLIGEDAILAFKVSLSIWRGRGGGSQG